MRLLVNVSFDPLRGYVGTAPEMRAAVTAMSLNGLQGPSVPENRSRSTPCADICRAFAALQAATNKCLARKSERLKTRTGIGPSEQPLRGPAHPEGATDLANVKLIPARR